MKNATHQHIDSEVKYQIYFSDIHNEWRLRGRFIDITLTSARMAKLRKL